MFTATYRLILMWLVLAISTQPAHAEWAADLADGSPLPVINAPDPFGNRQNNGSLMGKAGLLFQFNRSSDW